MFSYLVGAAFSVADVFGVCVLGVTVPMPWVLSPNYKPTNPWNGKVMVVSKWR
jgi:hypothetical protein